MIATLLFAATLQIAPISDPPSACGPSRSNEDIRQDLESLVAAHPGAASLTSLGRSLGGRDLLLLTLSSDAARADDRPGILLVAGLDGLRGSTTEIALRMAKSLLESHAETLEQVTVYIVPRANPDAVEHFRALPSSRGSLNMRPDDEDRDHRIDEDGPVDLDHNGIITLMRKLDPQPSLAAPTLVIDEKEPRIMRAPDRARGEIPRYAIWIEGLDADGDGLIAEDGEGGVDPDLNFPYRWPEFDSRAGMAPLSEPESHALASFVLKHPRLIAVETLGRHDNVVNLPDSRGRDATGRQPLLLDEADAPAWTELAKAYRETTGQSRAAGSDPAGSFELWAQVQRGIPSVATTVWGRPDPAPKAPDASAPAAGSADAAASTPAPNAGAPAPDAAAPAPAAPTPPAPASPDDSDDHAHPAPVPPAANTAPPPSAPAAAPPRRGGGRRGGPGGGPGGAPRAPGADAAQSAARDAKVDDPDAKAWLEYSDRERNGEGFVNWAPFEHPTLGAVEIGGFVPGFRENPPAAALDELAAKQVEWLVKLASMRPTLLVRGPEVRRLADGLVQIDLSVANSGRLPITMTPGKADSMARPLVMRVTAPLERVKSGRRVETTRGLDPGAEQRANWIIEERAGEPFDVIVAHPTLGEWSVRIDGAQASVPSLAPGALTIEEQLIHPDDGVARADSGGASGKALPDPAWNRFYDMDEVTAMLQEFASARPELARLEQIGTSVEARPIWLLTVTNFATGDPESKPAMYVDGSIHANEIQATETVLYSIWYLLKNHGRVDALTELLDRSAFYFVPVVNPDSRASWFRDPNSPHSGRTGRQLTDNDGDGLFDEDGPNDLNGDGSIGQMWRKDPFGTHRRNLRDPRILEPVPSEPRPDGTREYGEWSRAGEEGIDDDGDGRINEDGAGGYDMNRNWPSDWQPNSIQSGAGPWPFYYPETRSIGLFLAGRPNLAAGQAFHNAGGMILRGPGAAYREGDYPPRDRAIYDAIATAGVEMLPFYRSLVIHSGLYTVHGGLVNWLAEGLGVISFTNELWTDQRILQNGRDPTSEERQRWQDRMLFGQTWSDWTEVPHPEFGTVLVGGGTKFSSRIPPGFMLEEECHRNFAFVVHHASQMPLLRWESVETKPLGGDLWEVTVAIANDRLIPTRTQRAADKHIGEPDLFRIDGVGVTVVAAGIMGSRNDRTFVAQAHQPEALLIEGGVPGHGTRVLRAIVKGREGDELRLRFDAEKARNLDRTIRLNRE